MHDGERQGEDAIIIQVKPSHQSGVAAFSSHRPDLVLNITSPLQFLAGDQDSFLLTRSHFGSCSLRVSVDAAVGGGSHWSWPSLSWLIEAMLEARLGDMPKGSLFSNQEVMTVCPVNRNLLCRRPQGQTAGMSVLCGALTRRKKQSKYFLIFQGWMDSCCLPPFIELLIQSVAEEIGA